jgi:hypothetical protein
MVLLSVQYFSVFFIRSKMVLKVLMAYASQGDILVGTVHLALCIYFE